MAKIAVTGVTGNLGRIVIEALLDRVAPDDLIAVARTPGKAADFIARGVDVRHGDYDDAGSLDTALAGVDVLLLVSSPDLAPGVRLTQHRTVISAAAGAGVRRVVYTSGIGAGGGDGQALAADHIDTERALGDSGLGFTVLRNALYSEAFLGTALAQASRTGEVTSATDGRPLNTARLRDLALAASSALTGSGHDNATYELYGPLWTYAELADVLAGVLGKPVSHREVTDADAGWLGSLFPLVRSGAFSRTGPDLERLLGRPPAGPHDTLTALVERQTQVK